MNMETKKVEITQKSENRNNKYDLHGDLSVSLTMQAIEYALSKYLKICTHKIYPTKMKREDVIDEIEKLFEKRTKDEIYIQKFLSEYRDDTELIDLGDFCEYSYRYFINKYSGNIKVAESKLLSLISAAEIHFSVCEQNELFLRLMGGELGRSELSCFLLLRHYSVEEFKDICKRDHRIKKQYESVHLFIFSMESCWKILNKVFIAGGLVDVKDVFNRLFPSTSKDNKGISFYRFILCSIQIYKVEKSQNRQLEETTNTNDRDRDRDEKITNTFESQNDLSKEEKQSKLEEDINMKMKDILQQLFFSLKNENFKSESFGFQKVVETYKEIYSKMISLTKCLIEKDKLKWFSTLSISEPNENDLDFADSIFKQYRNLYVNLEYSQKDIESLCKLLFKEPHITKYISDLLKSLVSELDNEGHNLSL